ncbi:ParB family protein [Leifsonia poae]|uniref:ParB family protein n=1 Tax=Leifsonia poae TaxID=110933 RepID=UPI003D671843
MDKTIARQEKASVTVYLDSALRNRARTAFRATSGDEHDISWSDFVLKAVLAEVRRRELEYNSGQPYEESDRPLAPGAPPSWRNARRQSPYT